MITVTDETCQNYVAEDRECKPYGKCETCTPTNGSTCYSIKDPITYWVGDFGTVSGSLSVPCLTQSHSL